jgi:hypothetical protein
MDSIFNFFFQTGFTGLRRCFAPARQSSLKAYAFVKTTPHRSTRQAGLMAPVKYAALYFEI